MTAAIGLWGPVLRAPFFEEIEARLRAGEGGLCVTGLVEGSRAMLAALLARRLDRPLLLVVPDDAALEAYRRDLSAFAELLGREPGGILILPALDADPYDAIAPHPEVVRERVVAIGRLQQRRFDVLIVPVRALCNPLPSVKEWQGWLRRIAPGDSLPPDRFMLECIGLGYRRVDIVSAAGEVSRRGGIVDVFPPQSREPARIELFGDQIESIRSFDTDHQRSTGQLDEVWVGPAVENPPTEAGLRRVRAYLEGGLGGADRDDGTSRKFRQHLDVLADQGYWPGFEGLARLTAAEPVTLFEHAHELLVVVDEPSLTDQELLRADHDQRTAYEQSENRVLPPPNRLFADVGEVRERLGQSSLFLQELAGDPPSRATVTVNTASRTSRNYSGRIKDWITDLRKSLDGGTRTVCVLRAQGSADRVVEILTEYEIPATRFPADRPDSDVLEARGGIFVGVGPLRHGFELPGSGLGVLTERDLFGETRRVADRKSKQRAVFISDFRDLKQGDLVVHVDHGVAQYGGMGRPKGGSLNRDFMVLEFARGDKLFVPVDRLDLVQKYSGVAGSKPPLAKLGSPSWERVKARVRKSVESMAKELLQLYAQRKAARGHRFAEDTPWQRELESAFPFELTADQQRAVMEIKHDMESERPTDRLLVGDVGFGKTEVAIRAAFKAVMDGFQVAVLAPTTVLAFQHHETFRQRFAAFPVRVEMVSRFRTAAETKQVLKELATGAVDVLIGTHRLLSKDVEFKQLGLLVVDEEQRFGVAHKERLKKMALGVDAISMTATPIPRTLQMSLAGVRDLSVIETPPPGRTAIQTYVIPFRKNVLGQAIRQELRREGQVFFVHNKVETLPAIVRAVEELVPEARIGVAHGQMPERRLERVMFSFVEHETDVLVTTTIIENGLDIPRANTIIVNRADHFGLAQLYQLRGRVGRSQEHAYAYFVVPSRDQLHSDARRRLRALQEFSDLGAGFRLAAADLEIRGAGELLGSKQHGHIASLGFDLYCQMLERSVQELQGEPVTEGKPVSLHLGVDIKIPNTYLPDSADRLVIYKRLAQARTAEEIERLQTETEDRYGHLPEPVRALFQMGSLRLLAEAVGVKSVDLVEDRLHVRFHELPRVEPRQVLEIVSREGGRLTPAGILVLPAPSPDDRIRPVARLMRELDGTEAAT